MLHTLSLIQAAVGNLAQELHEEKQAVSELTSSGMKAGQTTEPAIKINLPDVPAKVLRQFHNGVSTRLLMDPMIQVTGQNKNLTFVRSTSLRNQSLMVLLWRCKF